MSEGAQVRLEVLDRLACGGIGQVKRQVAVDTRDEPLENRT